MVEPQRIPADDVRVLDGPIRFSPRWKPFQSTTTGDINSRSLELVRIVRRCPHLVLREGTYLLCGVFQWHVRDGRGTRHDFVPGGIAYLSMLCRIDEVPHAGPPRINIKNRVLLGLCNRRFGYPNTLAGVPRDLWRNQPNDHKTVVRAVDIQVKTIREIVIVIYCHYLGRHQSAVAALWRVADHAIRDRLFHGLGFHDAGCTNGNADRSVLLADHVENVIVVAHHCGGPKHQFATRTATD